MYKLSISRFTGYFNFGSEAYGFKAFLVFFFLSFTVRRDGATTIQVAKFKHITFELRFFFTPKVLKLVDQNRLIARTHKSKETYVCHFFRSFSWFVDVVLAYCVWVNASTLASLFRS